MNLSERRVEAGETSERVAFICPGCGIETVIHVGLMTALSEKRCMKCRGTARTGRNAGSAVRGIVGTHQGRIKDPQRRKVKQAAAARNRTRRAGLRAKNGTTYRESCRSYGCAHRKHGAGKKVS